MSIKLTFIDYFNTFINVVQSEIFLYIECKYNIMLVAIKIIIIGPLTFIY